MTTCTAYHWLSNACNLVTEADPLKGSGTQAEGSCFVLKTPLIPKISYGADLTGHGVVTDAASLVATDATAGATLEACQAACTLNYYCKGVHYAGTTCTLVTVEVLPFEFAQLEGAASATPDQTCTGGIAVIGSTTKETCLTQAKTTAGCESMKGVAFGNGSVCTCCTDVATVEALSGSEVWTITPAAAGTAAH